MLFQLLKKYVIHLFLVMIYLNSFRRKPAITEFDWLITPNHRSFQSFATLTDTVIRPIVKIKLDLIPAHD